MSRASDSALTRTLRAGPASVTVDMEAGGRLSSISVFGHELLIGDGTLGPLQWGCYPMVPWAGRVRDGRFDFGGRSVQLPLNLPPHSGHGTGFVSEWRPVEPAAGEFEAVGLELDLVDPWPFPGRVEQRIELTAEGLAMELGVEAEVEMPAMLGWHPWFVRHLSSEDGSSVEAALDFGAPSMYELDDVAIPTGRLVERPEGPWDNCFTGLDRDPTIVWPGVLELKLSSTCDHWVVFTEPEGALCVEPQSAAPDVFNREPELVPAGGRMTHRFFIDWSPVPDPEG